MAPRQLAAIARHLAKTLLVLLLLVAAALAFDVVRPASYTYDGAKPEALLVRSGVVTQGVTQSTPAAVVLARYAYDGLRHVSQGEHGPATGLLAAEDASVGMSFTEEQVQSQLAQHGGDFGFQGANNAAGRLDYLSRLVDHVDAPGTTRIVGTYRGEAAIHYLDPETGLNLFTTPQGGFWAAWQLGPEQIENVVLRGSLR